MRNDLRPIDLEQHLSVAPSFEIEFRTEKEADNYRQKIYALNSGKRLIYRTRKVYRTERGRFYPVLIITRHK